MRTHKVGPEYRKPVASVSQEWIDFNDPRVISEQQSVNECAWWQSLNDSQLNQIVTQSYQQNLSLRAAGMRVMEARARRGIAAGLLFPQSQEAVGGYSRVQVSDRGNAFGLPIMSKSSCQSILRVDLISRVVRKREIHAKRLHCRCRLWQR